jgi:hypothetical protein
MATETNTPIRIVDTHYMGMRLHGKIPNYYYQVILEEKESPEVLCFSKKLLGYEMIGNVVTMEERSPAAYGGARLHKDPTSLAAAEEDITKWSTQHRLALLEKEARQDAKKENPASIEAKIKDLVDAIQRTNLTSAARKRIARYVFEKLL